MKFDELRRPEFITLLGGAAATWALPLSAQQRGMAKIGVLYPGIASALPTRLAGLRAGLQASNYRDEIEIIPRSADGDPSRLSALAAELVECKAEIIVAISPAAVRAAQSATGTIPIIALDVESDPLGSGLLKSLSRPGGQVSGVFFDFPDFSKKWLELLKEAMPRVARVAVLWDPGTGTVQMKGAEEAAKALGVRLEIMEVGAAVNLDDAILAASRNGADAVPDFARLGGLMAYGVNPVDVFRQGGTMVAKVLRGTKPAELPAELPTKFQMVLNLKTAKAIGIELPTSILLRADEVIE